MCMSIGILIILGTFNRQIVETQQRNCFCLIIFIQLQVSDFSKFILYRH